MMQLHMFVSLGAHRLFVLPSLQCLNGSVELLLLLPILVYTLAKNLVAVCPRTLRM